MCCLLRYPSSTQIFYSNIKLCCFLLALFALLSHLTLILNNRIYYMPNVYQLFKCNVARHLVALSFNKCLMKNKFLYIPIQSLECRICFRVAQNVRKIIWKCDCGSINVLILAKCEVCSKGTANFEFSRTTCSSVLQRGQEVSGLDGYMGYEQVTNKWCEYLEHDLKLGTVKKQEIYLLTYKYF